MTRILIPALFAASPALAHDGMHLHPHGAESSFAAMGLLGVVAAAVAALVWIRR